MFLPMMDAANCLLEWCCWVEEWRKCLAMRHSGAWSRDMAVGLCCLPSSFVVSPSLFIGLFVPSDLEQEGEKSGSRTKAAIESVLGFL